MLKILFQISQEKAITRKYTCSLKTDYHVLHSLFVSNSTRMAKGHVFTLKASYTMFSRYKSFSVSSWPAFNRSSPYLFMSYEHVSFASLWKTGFHFLALDCSVHVMHKSKVSRWIQFTIATRDTLVNDKTRRQCPFYSQYLSITVR